MKQKCESKVVGNLFQKVESPPTASVVYIPSKLRHNLAVIKSGNNLIGSLTGLNLHPV